MSGLRLTPRRKALIEALRQGAVVKRLSGWRLYGLFQPGQAGSHEFFNSAEIEALRGPYLQGYNRTTGAPVESRAEHAANVEFRLRPDGGVQ